MRPLAPHEIEHRAIDDRPHLLRLLRVNFLAETPPDRCQAFPRSDRYGIQGQMPLPPRLGSDSIRPAQCWCRSAKIRNGNFPPGTERRHSARWLAMSWL